MHEVHQGLNRQHNGNASMPSTWNIALNKYLQDNVNMLTMRLFAARRANSESSCKIAHLSLGLKRRGLIVCQIGGFSAKPCWCKAYRTRHYVSHNCKQH